MSLGALWDYVYYRVLEVSTLSLGEYAAIVATFQQIGTDDEKDVLRSRGYSEAEIKIALKGKQPKVTRILDLEFSDPPKIVYPLYDYVAHAYYAYKKGILPYPGSYSEQPAKIVEIFKLFQMLENKLKMDLHKEHKRKASGKS